MGVKRLVGRRPITAKVLDGARNIGLQLKATATNPWEPTVLIGYENPNDAGSMLQRRPRETLTIDAATAINLGECDARCEAWLLTDCDLKTAIGQMGGN